VPPVHGRLGSDHALSRRLAVMLMVSGVLRPSITSTSILSPISTAGTRIIRTGVTLNGITVLVEIPASEC
jgi:hypothetical protein